MDPEATLNIITRQESGDSTIEEIREAALNLLLWLARGGEARFVKEHALVKCEQTLIGALDTLDAIDLDDLTLQVHCNDHRFTIATKNGKVLHENLLRNRAWKALFELGAEDPHRILDRAEGLMGSVLWTTVNDEAR